MVCLPTVTRELTLGTVGATVATTRAAGGRPQGELHGGEHHRGAGLARTAIRAVREVAQAVDDGQPDHPGRFRRRPGRRTGTPDGADQAWLLCGWRCPSRL